MLTTERSVTNRNLGEISEVQLARARDHANLAPKHQLRLSLIDLRRALVELEPLLFTQDQGARQLNPRISDRLREGLDLPNGYIVRWCRMYGQNVEGRLYIQNSGIGVSFRPERQGGFVYTYHYDQDRGSGQRVREIASMRYTSGRTPVLLELNGERCTNRGLPGDSSPPPAVEIAPAYISVAVTALMNLSRETAHRVPLYEASFGSRRGNE